MLLLEEQSLLSLQHPQLVLHLRPPVRRNHRLAVLPRLSAAFNQQVYLQKRLFFSSSRMFFIFSDKSYDHAWISVAKFSTLCNTGILHRHPCCKTSIYFIFVFIYTYLPQFAFGFIYSFIVFVSDADTKCDHAPLR
jgi:hypothetical protein